MLKFKNSLNYIFSTNKIISNSGKNFKKEIIK